MRVLLIEGAAAQADVVERALRKADL